MEGGRGGDGPAYVVRRHEHEVRIRPGRDLLALEQTADGRDVRLHDVRGLELEQLAELVADVNPLTCRDRDLDVRGDLSKRLQVFRRHRLFDPAGVEAFELSRDGDCGRGREATMHLDEELRVRSDRVANRFDEGQRVPAFLGTELVCAGAEGVELERAIAACDHPPGSLVKFGGRPLHRVPAVGVSLDAVANGAAEQPVDGLRGRFADDVPAGDLDRGDA